MPEPTPDATASEPEPTRVEELPEATPKKNPAASVKEVDQGDARTVPDVEEVQAEQETPEILSGEPILPPPPESACVPIAQLVFMGEGSGTPSQRPLMEDQSVVGAGVSEMLVFLLKWQYAVLTKLIKDPMLTSAVLKQFQDSMKEFYKFVME